MRPKPKVCRSSGYIYPRSQYKKAFDWILEATKRYDEEVEIVAVGLYPPGIDELCIMVLLVTFKDTLESATQALRPAEDDHPPGALVEWFNKEDSLESQYCDQAAANPEGHRYCADNAYIINDADVSTVLQDAFCTLPSKKAFTLWYAMYPCSRRKLPDMALSMQTDHYFALYTIWEDAKDDDRCQAWVRNIMKGVERHSAGAYLGDSDFQIRRTKFWGDEQAKKLMTLRRTWDPAGRICGYLDVGDKSQLNGLENVHEWENSR